MKLSNLLSIAAAGSVALLPLAAGPQSTEREDGLSDEGTIAIVAVLLGGVVAAAALSGGGNNNNPASP